MRIALTGTPGTGKTTASERLAGDLDIVHLNDIVTDEGLTLGHDEARDSAIADLDAIAERLADRDDILIESHLAHHLDVDRVIVLRCHPETLIERLEKRGESPDSAHENAESEALDVVLAEAVERHGREAVHEVDTTGRDPDAVAADVRAVLAGDREPSAGEVDFTGYL